VHEVNLAQRKSYTSEDEHGFKVEAYIDALHIREAITTHPDASLKNPIKHLIERNLLSAEELVVVGLEHKISEVSGKKKEFKRKCERRTKRLMSKILLLLLL
jgi:hypothetical protein